MMLIELVLIITFVVLLGMIVKMLREDRRANKMYVRRASVSNVPELPTKENKKRMQKMESGSKNGFY